MLRSVHLTGAYQDFLISEQRKGLIPPDLYDALIPEYFDGLNILDFGCGLGYSASYYSEKFSRFHDYHIYACDYQVEVLDYFWKRIADNHFKNVTAFFMPNRSRLHFPAWVPRVHYLMLSLSLSTADNPVDILKTAKPILEEKAKVHIIDWDADKPHDELDQIYPIKYRIRLNQVQDYLQQAGYHIVKTYRTTGPFFALSAEPEKGENKRYTEMEAHATRVKNEAQETRANQTPGDSQKPDTDEDLSRRHEDVRNEDEFQ